MTEDASLKHIGKSHSYNTRQKNELNLPKATGLYKSSFYVKGLKEYSMLAAQIKDLKSTSQFVNKCKKQLIKEQELQAVVL